MTRCIALRCRVEVALVLGETVQATLAAGDLVDLARHHRMLEQEAWAHALAAEAEDHESAHRHARTALDLAVEHGFVPVETRVAECLGRLGVPEMSERSVALRSRLMVPPLPPLVDEDR